MNNNDDEKDKSNNYVHRPTPPYMPQNNGVDNSKWVQTVYMTPLAEPNTLESAKQTEASVKEDSRQEHSLNEHSSISNTDNKITEIQMLDTSTNDDYASYEFNNYLENNDHFRAVNAIIESVNKGENIFRLQPSQIPIHLSKQKIRNSHIKEMTDIMKRYSFYNYHDALLLWDKTYWSMSLDDFAKFCRKYLPEDWRYIEDKDASSIYKMLIADQPQIDERNFDDCKHFITFEDGQYNVRDQHFHYGFSPKIYTIGSLPVRYIDCANWFKNEPRYFTDYLNLVSNGDPKMIEYIYEHIGYWISNFILKKCDIIVGEKDSGKSTLVHLLTHLVGKQFVSTVPLNELGDRFKRADIYGKKLNVNTDISDMKLNNDGIFKMFTGGGRDGISAEFKYKNSFTFIARAKLIFCTNNLSSVNIKNINTDAVRERINVIRFNGSIPKQNLDENIDQKYIAEKEGIIWLALGALTRLYENNFQFTEYEQGFNTKMEFDKIANPILGKLREFINNYCIIDYRSAILKEDFIQAFNGVMKQNLSSISFTKNYFDIIKTEYKIDSVKKRINTDNPQSALLGIELRKDLFY